MISYIIWVVGHINSPGHILEGRRGGLLISIVYISYVNMMSNYRASEPQVAWEIVGTSGGGRKVSFIAQSSGYKFYVIYCCYIEHIKEQGPQGTP